VGNQVFNFGAHSISIAQDVWSIAFLRSDNAPFNNPLSVQVRLAFGGEAAAGPVASFAVLVYRPLVTARAPSEGRYADCEG
jgi:hypothetical protein